MAKKKTARGADAKGGADVKGPARKPEAQAEERRPTFEDRFAEFSARYKWYVFVPIAIAMVAVIVLAVVSGQHKRRARNALEAFGAARTAAEFNAVAKQYPRTFPGRNALVRAGDILYGQGEYAEARKHYEAYLNTDPDPVLAMPIWMAIVQTYVAEKDYAKGISTCDTILIQPGSEYVRMQALYYKGYCYEMSGDTERAMIEYGKVTLPDQQGRPWYWLADERRTDLERKTKAAEREAAETTGGGAGTTGDAQSSGGSVENSGGDADESPDTGNGTSDE
jgi:tetratricopeptide (TPR) repeat protein